MQVSGSVHSGWLQVCVSACAWVNSVSRVSNQMLLMEIKEDSLVPGELLYLTSPSPGGFPHLVLGCVCDHVTPADVCVRWIGMRPPAPSGIPLH